MHFFKKHFAILTLATTIFGLNHTVYADTTVEDSFVILHINDMHARIEEDDYAGMGVARISTKLNQLKEEWGENKVLALDAGDTFHGQPIATISKGESIVKIVNALGLDATVPGNHEFNYGVERLLEIEDMLNFPMVAGNVLDNNTNEQLFNAYTIKEVSGQKVGIFGLATPETAYKTSPLNVAHITFQDPVATAQQMVDELDGQVDFIIALAHLGMEGDYTSVNVAEQVYGIDLIVDGHSHTELPEGYFVNDTYIVQAGEYTENIGIVEVDVLSNGEFEIRPSLITKEEGMLLEQDPKILSVLEEINAEFDVLTSEIVAYTNVFLDGERNDVRTGETNLGNLITNAILAETGADVVLSNGGNIRASIDIGDITKAKIIEVLPFGNYTMTIEVLGHEILEALEIGLDSYPEAKGGFPHIAGMNVIFDPTQPAGQRVASVTMDNGSALESTKTYILATNDFIKAGGDGYELFADKAVVNDFSATDESVINYLTTRGTEGIEVSGRIQTIEHTYNNEPMLINYIEEPTPVIPEYTPHTSSYIIQYGDTLKKIATKYNTSVEFLIEINENIDNPNIIYAGHTIFVPVQ
ncbi:MAG: hypothetical protein ATN36_01505 [Epulopiscium sp. Nele67-Bin005]|nr:MAG: hypothetical protein ATN36_01505 [Epulopiscium sp. Nele67-Bin005]